MALSLIFPESISDLSTGATLYNPRQRLFFFIPSNKTMYVLRRIRRIDNHRLLRRFIGHEVGIIIALPLPYEQKHGYHILFPPIQWEA